MTNKISRREALKVGAFGILGGLAACSPAAQATQELLPTYAPFPTGTLAPTSTSAPNQIEAATSTPVATLVDDIAMRAQNYLNSLDESQRTKSTYAFDDPELTRWHWTTPQNFRAMDCHSVRWECPSVRRPLTAANQSVRVWIAEITRYYFPAK